MPRKFVILFVDDDQSIQQIAERAARSSFPAATLVFLSSSREVKAYFENPENQLPKLVLLDVNLNEQVNGIEILSSLRARRRTYTVPVIVFTGDELGRRARQAYSTGASSFTIKPFSYEQWKNYMTLIRQYWFETVQLPPDPDPDDSDIM